MKQTKPIAAVPLMTICAVSPALAHTGGVIGGLQRDYRA